MSRKLILTSLQTSLRNLRQQPQRLQPALQQRFSSDWSHLQKELPERKLPLVYDYLAPTPSHLLNIALADVLPKSAAPTSSDEARDLPSVKQPYPLPPSQHLVYFPPAIPGDQLLSDGTDPLQSPGEPFVRRMWAGGAVRFNLSQPNLLALDGGRAVCMEGIRDVSIKGKEGQEKIFVGIERRVGRADEGENADSVRQRLWRDTEEDFGEAGVIERRNIVFMRERSKEQAVKDMEAAKKKMLMPPEEGADFTHSFTPDEKLLFRYSALTYNAHAIHLDPKYCQEVEGHREKLVHGPLSFTLLVTLLRGQLPKGEEIKSIEYRNLSPLYAHEVLKLAGRKVEDGKWEVWAETPEGGLGIKGTVKTQNV